jgi:poly-gamma-glutamate capsule biosynthesis protein CapA/YwtB (metallophosphatase superfamily)
MLAKVVCHSADVVSRRVRQRRRQVTVVGVLVFLLLIFVIFFSGGGKKATPPAPAKAHTTQAFPAHSPLNPDWTGSGKPVTLAFGGDVHFEGTVGASLQQNAATALGTTFPTLFSGAQLSMVNFESALTAGTCPEPQTKPYIFFAPPTALTALQQAGVTVASDANDHSVDCGQEGLSQGLTAVAQAKYPMLGIGSNAAQAFAPYRATIKGQRVAIITATQVIAPNLVTTWTATSSQAGVASAIDPTQLVQTVQAARRSSDTVVVYLHWGTETVTCPNPQQQPLAQQLVKAGADIVVGSGTHVLSGGGYLGGAYVDYGLGNFAFYDSAPPETDSGSLLVTAIGRKIVTAVFRPATDVNGLPQPLTGTAAQTAVASWDAARGCTGLSAAPAASQTTVAGETAPFVAPSTTTTTTTTAPTTASTTATTSGSSSSASSTTTTSTTTAATTTAPTDNAG